MRCDRGLQTGGRRKQGLGTPQTERGNTALGSPSTFQYLTEDVHRHYDAQPYFLYPQASMDPLSFTASLIGVIGIAIALAKTIEKLREVLHDASSDLCSLSNEISDFRIVLDAVASVLQDWQDGKHPRPLTDMGLTHILSRSEAELMKLNNLVLSCLINPNTTSAVRPNKVKWFCERKRIKAAQGAIRARKQDLLTLISTYNMSGIAQLNISIHEISMGVENIPAKIIEQRESDRDQNMQITTVEKPTSQHLEDVTVIFPTNGSNEGLPSTPEGLLSIIQDAELVRFQASFYRKRACKLLCSCRCHRRKLITTPAFIKRFIGSLFVGYSGLPIITPKCNEKQCRQNTETKVNISYQFPKWFWIQQFLRASITVSQSGPEMLLRVQNVYPWCSPIYQSCLDGNVAGLKRFFEERIISPYDVDRQGRSLIHNAFRGKNTYETCKLFISAGADMHQEDQWGNSAFYTAWDKILLAPIRSKNEQKLIKLFPLAEGGLDDRHFTRIHKIVLGILPNSLRDELAESTALIDVGDNVGRTPLLWASSRGDIEAVSLLLQYGANPRLGCTYGGPLHMAAGNGHAEITRMLLDAGAEIESRNAELRTPLIVASCANDGNDCIKILLDYGAGVNEFDCHRETALLEASHNGMEQNLKLLLSRGAEIDFTEHEGWTPFAAAIFWKERNTMTTLRALIEAGANHRIPTDAGENMLHLAAQYSSLAVLQTLVDLKLSGLDPEAKTNDGLTPSEMAHCRPDVDDEWWVAFRQLLKNAAEPLSAAKITVLEVQPKIKSVDVKVIAIAYDESDDEMFKDAVEHLPLNTVSV